MRPDQQELIKEIILSIPLSKWIKTDGGYYTVHKGKSINLFFNQGYSDWDFSLDGMNTRVHIFGLGEYISRFIDYLNATEINNEEKTIDDILTKW